MFFDRFKKGSHGTSFFDIFYGYTFGYMLALKEIRLYNRNLPRFDCVPIAYEHVDFSLLCLKKLPKSTPKSIYGTLLVQKNLLTSFKNFPKRIECNCWISLNKFTSFKDADKHIEYIGMTMVARHMDITSGYSDLFGIDGLQSINIDNEQIQDIVNKYLPEKDIINFQDEMIKSGYESYL